MHALAGPVRRARAEGRPGPSTASGLRGNDSRPVDRRRAWSVADVAMLGADGGGLDSPWLGAAVVPGAQRRLLPRPGRAVDRRGRRPPHRHPPRAPRPDAGRAAGRPGSTWPGMRIATDRTRGLPRRHRSPPWRSGRDDATLRVLEVKAVAAEAAVDVTDLAMRVCGGAAFRKELGVERRFRDARAARVMAPTTDTLLRLHRPGHLRPAPLRRHERVSLMGAVAYDPKVVTIWDGFRAWFARRRVSTSTTSSIRTTSARSRTWSPAASTSAWNSPLAWVRGRRAAGAGGEAARHARHRPDLTSVVVVRADSDIETSPTSPGGRWRPARSTHPRPP